MISKLIARLRDRRGEFLLDSALRLLLGCAVLVLAITLFGLLAQANRLSAVANDLTRYIELRGEVSDADVVRQLSQLCATAGLAGVDVEVDAVFSAGGRRIQFGDPFTVTLRYSGSFGIGGVMSVSVPFHSSVTGRSEKYWK